MIRKYYGGNDAAPLPRKISGPQKGETTGKLGN
jgi:hypothetical protein